MLTDCKTKKDKMRTPTCVEKAQSPLIQSAITATSEEIEIQLCDDEVIEFDLSEKSSVAGEICSRDSTKKNKERELIASWRRYEEARLFRSSDLDQPE